jgi:hypothetical protein
MADLFRASNRLEVDIDQSPVSAEPIGGFDLIGDGMISGRLA